MDVWLDATATHARPPAQAQGFDPGTYGLLGILLEVDGAEFGLWNAALHGGRAAGGADELWFNGTAGGTITRRLGRFSVGAGLEVFGLNYVEPYRYTGYGAALRPRVAAGLGGAVLTASLELTRGRWRTGAASTAPELPDAPGPFATAYTTSPLAATTVAGGGEAVGGALSVTGGSVRIGRALGPLWADVTAERYHAENGTGSGRYQGVGADVSFTVGRVDASLGTRWWHAPDTSAASGKAELGYHASVQVGLGPAVTTYAHVGRSVSDPLYGTPGAVSAGVGIRWRVGGRAERRGAIPVVEVGESTPEGRTVRFRFGGAEAQRVAVAGDFTDWTPVPMRRQGAYWVLETTLPPGLHHFAFVVDGEEWTVPAHAPGIVEDGWGRRNASILVEEL